MPYPRKPAPSTFFAIVFRYCTHTVRYYGASVYYTLFRSVRADQLRILQRGWQNPWMLLRLYRYDYRTLRFRIGSRLQHLPVGYWGLGLPAYEKERDAHGNLRPNIRTRACMTDIECFELEHTETTKFDHDYFLLGWKAGLRWAEHNSDFCKSELSAVSSSPNSIQEEVR